MCVKLSGSVDVHTVNYLLMKMQVKNLLPNIMGVDVFFLFMDPLGWTTPRAQKVVAKFVVSPPPPN